MLGKRLTKNDGIFGSTGAYQYRYMPFAIGYSKSPGALRDGGPPSLSPGALRDGAFDGSYRSYRSVILVPTAGPRDGAVDRSPLG